MATVLASPKTIIIAPVTVSNSVNKRQFEFTKNTTKMASLLTTSSSVDEDESSLQPRKRQKLDHLSTEQKMMRRKLKNRVAAQSARDRKKARMEILEIEVQSYDAKTQQLSEQVKKLKAKNRQLEKENEELKKRLSQTTESTEIKITKVESLSDVTVKQEPSETTTPCKDSSLPHESLEYASLISDPQQKGQDKWLTALWMMHFVGLLMLNLTNSTTFSKKSPLIWENQKTFLNPCPQSQTQSMKQRPKLKPMPPLERWRPEKTVIWNPSKI